MWKGARIGLEETSGESVGIAEPGAEEAADPDLERQIQGFNARQQMVYRAIRSEIGAGAANFVRSCAVSLTDGFNNLFAQVGLQDDGTWEAVGLRSSLQREGVLDPWIGFQRLLDKELEMLALHLGDARARELRQRIDDFERS